MTNVLLKSVKWSISRSVMSDFFVTAWAMAKMRAPLLWVSSEVVSIRFPRSHLTKESTWISALRARFFFVWAAKKYN